MRNDSMLWNSFTNQLKTEESENKDIGITIPEAKAKEIMFCWFNKIQPWIICCYIFMMICAYSANVSHSTYKNKCICLIRSSMATEKKKEKHKFMRKTYRFLH